MLTLNDAYYFMTLHHAGQFDKAGLPFILHPQRVMMRLPAWATDEEKQAALLHDVIEDTAVTADYMLEKGFSQRVVDIVQLVTNDKTTTYAEFIQKIVDSGNVSAMIVKLADNEDNSDPVRYGDWFGSDGGQSLLRRYQKARDVLVNALPYPYLHHWQSDVPRHVVDAETRRAA